MYIANDTQYIVNYRDSSLLMSSHDSIVCEIPKAVAQVVLRFGKQHGCTKPSNDHCKAFNRIHATMQPL